MLQCWWIDCHLYSLQYDHTTPLLSQLCWLKVAQQIDFKLTVLDYICRHGVASLYLGNVLNQPVDFEAIHHLRSAPSLSLSTMCSCQLNCQQPSFSSCRSLHHLCTVSYSFLQSAQMCLFMSCFL